MAELDPKALRRMPRAAVCLPPEFATKEVVTVDGTTWDAVLAILERGAEERADLLAKLVERDAALERIPELEREIANLEADLHSQDADYWHQRAERVEAAARPFANCSRWVTVETVATGGRVGPCGSCAGCLLVAALAAAPAPGEGKADG